VVHAIVPQAQMILRPRGASLGADRWSWPALQRAV